MPRVEMTVAHQLGRDEAVRRLTQKVDFLQQTYGSKAKDVQQEWTDNVLWFTVQAMGFKISGSVTVEESDVQLQADIPLTALPFKSLVERRVKDDLTQMLA